LPHHLQTLAALLDVYQKVFGGELRKRGDGAIAFDDKVGQVSGTWVLNRPPSTAPGLMLYITVMDAAATVNSIVANGAEIVQPIAADHSEITARFRDPGGNVIGIYLQLPKAVIEILSC
jgi:predicted enzyme related to lactoylglutathione lyase